MGIVMIKNYLKVAFRNLIRKKGYSFITITGLAIGIACCIIILLFVRQETSYDSFHEYSERIYRVQRAHTGSSGETIHHAVSNYALAPLLKENLPTVSQVVRIARIPEKVSSENTVFQENRFFYTDPEIFKVFTVNMVMGNPETALDEPMSIVLTKRASQKYFGGQDPLGKTLEIDDEHLFTVTGVVEDFPVNSHMHFDFLANIESTRRWFNDIMYEKWGNVWVRTYLLLEPGARVQDVGDRMDLLVERNGPPELSSFRVDFSLFPLEDIHLYSHTSSELEAGTSSVFVYVFLAVAILILAIACFNFISLATARSAWRAKEVGMRKTLGAHRGNLIRQFIGESLLITTLSLGIALLLVYVTVPYLNQYLNTKIALAFLDSPALLASIVGLLIIVGLLAGSYPAFVLSSFKPITVLKGQITGNRKGMEGKFQKAVVVFQFTMSVMLIAGTLVIFNQLHYVRNQNLGFDQEQVMIIRLNNRAATQNIDRIKQVLRQKLGVGAVGAASDALPAGLNSWIARRKGASQGSEELLKVMAVDEDFFELMDIPVVEGRNFSKDRSADSRQAVIFNEIAVEHYGLKQPIGTEFYFETMDFNKEVIGVVRNFHNRSLHEEMVPISFHLHSDWFSNLYVKLKTEDIQGSVSRIEEAWESMFPGWPFQYSFLDQAFEQQYRSDENLGQLIGIFSLLAIFVGCLGLFGLASFTTEQRFKEIGVRKVLGASISGILSLLSRDYLVLIGVSILLAVPMTWWMMDQWLANFTYRISIGPGLFLISGLIAAAIGLATVSIQSARAATMNPVDALRSE